MKSTVMHSADFFFHLPLSEKPLVPTPYGTFSFLESFRELKDSGLSHCKILSCQNAASSD